MRSGKLRWTFFIIFSTYLDSCHEYKSWPTQLKWSVTRHLASKHIKKKTWVSPKGFASVSELLAACDRFSGSSPEHWRQDSLWRDEWKLAKQPHFDKQKLSHTLTIPLVFEEPVGVFLLGLLLLQQRQQPLLLLTGAIHEVIPWLKQQNNKRLVRLKANNYFNECLRHSEIAKADLSQQQHFRSHWVRVHTKENYILFKTEQLFTSH